jgi:hypothetical protein
MSDIKAVDGVVSSEALFTTLPVDAVSSSFWPSDSSRFT